MNAPLPKELSFAAWLAQFDLPPAFAGSESARYSWQRGETIAFALDFWRSQQPLPPDHRRDNEEYSDGATEGNDGWATGRVPRERFE